MTELSRDQLDALKELFGEYPADFYGEAQDFKMAVRDIVDSTILAVVPPDNDLISRQELMAQLLARRDTGTKDLLYGLNAAIRIVRVYSPPVSFASKTREQLAAESLWGDPTFLRSLADSIDDIASGRPFNAITVDEMYERFGLEVPVAVVPEPPAPALTKGDLSILIDGICICGGDSPPTKECQQAKKGAWLLADALLGQVRTAAPEPPTPESEN
jgi:hypothetical protein